MKVQHVRPKLVAIGAFVAVCLFIFVYLLGMTGVTLSDGYTVKARFPHAMQLVDNSDVRAQGVKIGRVVGIDNIGSVAEVEMALDDEITPVYRDATVQLRMKTLVGETYVDMDRGSPQAGALESGEGIPLARAEEAVRLDDILNALGPKTRERIKTNVAALSEGFGDHGEDMNEVLTAFEPVIGDGGRVLGVLEDERRRVAELLGQTGDVMQAFGERSASVRTLATSLLGAASAAEARDDEIRQTVRELPPTLRQAAESSQRLGGFAQRATPVVANLTAASSELAPVVRDLRPAARDARRLVSDLGDLVPEAGPLLDELKSFSSATQAVAPALGAVLREANPALDYLAPYSREFGAFFANIGAVIDTHDALGKIGRVHPVVSETSAAVWTPEMRDALNALIDSSGLEKFHRERSNAYPKPGTVGTPEEWDGTYPRVEAAPPSSTE